MAKQDERREFSPMVGTWPDAKKIRCRDCFLRDKTEVVIDGKRYKPGITKAFCAAYLPPPDSNGKPHDVLFRNADCKYYVPEEKAVK